MGGGWKKNGGVWKKSEKEGKESIVLEKSEFRWGKQINYQGVRYAYCPCLLKALGKVGIRLRIAISGLQLRTS